MIYTDGKPTVASGRASKPSTATPQKSIYLDWQAAQRRIAHTTPKNRKRPKGLAGTRRSKAAA